MAPKIASQDQIILLCQVRVKLKVVLQENISRKDFCEFLDEKKLFSPMVLEQRMRIERGQIMRALRDRRGHECGAIPGNMVVVVVDKHPKEKSGFSRIDRPAELYLNGECTDANGCYFD
jgi:hypothetical protein